MMFYLMWAIIFYTSWLLSSTSEGGIFPLSVIFSLGNSRVHVCILYHSNMASYVEALINERLSWSTILWIPNINLYNSHVWFWRDLDDLWFRSNVNIVKYVSKLDNHFHHIRVNKSVSIFNKIHNSKNL